MKVSHQRRPTAATIGAALSALREASAPAGALLRVEVPLTSAPHPLEWITHQPAGERLYWADRDGSSRIAGLGFAEKRPIHGDLSALPRSGGMRWFGGQAFDPDAPVSPEWSCFGPGQLLLPRLTLEQHGEQSILALHLLPGESNGLPVVNATPRTIPPLVSTGHVLEPNQSDWSEGVCAAVSAIEDGVLRKVVLSRRARVSLLNPPDPFALLAQLAAPQVSTFHFCFELAAGWAFLGCSPERLFARSGRQLQTEALAGTRRRGATDDTDQALAEDMLQSPKDREEHDHVVTSIATELTPVCTELSHPASPVVHRLHRVQHLLTPMGGTLSDGVDDETLLNALHPTPAVCGQPSRSARDFIHDHEPFHRGWYAGPIGWIGDDRSDFAVGIRSALLQDRDLWVCAGAGLVAASEPDAEWRELDAKSAQFLAMVEGS